MKKRTIILFVTDKCNRRCSYCRVHKGTNVMTFGSAKKALDDYFAGGKTKDEISVKFFGGEPLLALPLIKKIVAYIGAVHPKQKVSYLLTTNGDLLTPAVAIFLAQNNVAVTLSVDLEKKHYSGGRVDFDRRMLSALKMIPPRNITATIVVLPRKAGFVDSAFVQLFAMGFRSFHILPVYYTMMWDEKQLVALRNGIFRVIALAHMFSLEGQKVLLRGFQNKDRSDSPLFNKDHFVDVKGVVNQGDDWAMMPAGAETKALLLSGKYSDNYLKVQRVMDEGTAFKNQLEGK
jgi:sulfatase maturation enzyme AslB (radical SAM superfamily)